MKFELNKNFAHKIGLMLESRLIWYKHYDLWCEEIIDQYNEPPFWIIELATTKYIPDAVRIVNEYAYSEPFEQFSRNNDLFVACFFIRYERNEISWATFLENAGKYTDGNDAKVDCSYFFSMLNDYEDTEFSNKVEKLQSKKVYKEFISEIKEMQHYYNPFISYFKNYVENRG